MKYLYAALALLALLITRYYQAAAFDRCLNDAPDRFNPHGTDGCYHGL